jgi:HD-GYP domain-containing protein (c-di-GMP phosphodiesterase class II)
MDVRKPVKVLVSNLVPGMKLAHPVYDFHGHFLLNKGVTLTTGYIKALQKRHILSVYIEGVAIPEDFITQQQDAIEETIRADAFASIQNLFEKGDVAAIKAVTASVENIMRELMAGKTAIGALTEISSTDAYTYAHSVDVCILALETGILQKYEKDKLLKLGVGCILHDLGKVKTPSEILNKTGKLTNKEFDIIKKHPHDGYQLARKIQPDLAENSASIIYGHHERRDGRGYPLGLEGENIDEMSSICAIADAYNALTTDRPYRKAVPSNEAYEYLMASGYDIAGQKVRDAFLHCVTPFPVGSMVLLSTGDIGVVVQVNHDIPLRPQVYVATRKHMIDLSSELSITVLKISEEVIADQIITL